jgi:hypothetical protein
MPEKEAAQRKAPLQALAAANQRESPRRLFRAIFPASEKSLISRRADDFG